MSQLDPEISPFSQILPKIAMGVSLLIAFLSAVFSFFKDPQQVRNLAGSPLYVIPWVLLLLMILIFAWDLDPRIKRKGAFLFTHFAFVFLGFSVMMANITSRSMDIALPEQGSIAIPELQHRLGAPLTRGSFILQSFSKKDTGSDKNDRLFYISRVQVSNVSGTQSYNILVNYPLRLEGLKFYQSGWDFRITAFRFSFRGKEYILGKDQEMELRTPEGNLFLFHPVTVMDHDLMFAWNVTDPAGQILEQGSFKTSELLPGNPLTDRWGLSIPQADFMFISRLSVAYKPLLFLPAIAAGLFLLALAFQLWWGKKEVVS